MASKLMIEYKSGIFDSYFGREELFILIHYACQLDFDMAKDLYFALETEYIYRIENNIPLNGLKYDDSHETHWDVNKILNVVNFINNLLIPSLESESMDDIILILGGWNNLKTNIDQGANFKKRFGLITSEDRIFTELYNYVYFLSSFKDLANNALSINQAYYINYSD